MTALEKQQKKISVIIPVYNCRKVHQRNSGQYYKAEL